MGSSPTRSWVVLIMLRSSRGLGRYPFKVEIMGSNPIRSTKLMPRCRSWSNGAACKADVRGFKSLPGFQILHGLQTLTVKSGLLSREKTVRICRDPPNSWIISSIGRALHCHCRGKGIETPMVRQFCGKGAVVTDTMPRFYNSLVAQR